MKVLRRTLIAVFFAGFAAAAIRLRGRGGVPPQQGGWQELSANDLRQ